MEMSKREIVSDYQRAYSKKNHIKVLADLNCCKVRDIVEILCEDESVDREELFNSIPKIYIDFDILKIFIKYMCGDTDGQDMLKILKLNKELEEENRKLKEDIILKLNQVIKMMVEG